MRVPRNLPIGRILCSTLACTLCAVLVLSTGVVRADTVTKPYFKSFGSDVFVGGAFNQGIGGANCSANYQYPAGTQPANLDIGGIFALAKDKNGAADGGASSQYGAFATGQVQGTSGSGNGFYSGGAQAGSVSFNYLTFANNTTGSWGGGFDGNVSQSDCIPDYYDLKMPASPTALGAGSLPASPAEGSYSASGSPYHLNDSGVVTIKRGTSVTVYVNGSVYIGSDIKYDLDSVDNVPKFALVVKGDIYIGSSVSELDGLYIAQPTGSSGGDIWTCHGPTTNQMLYNNPALIAPCAGKLTVNGALIAEQINLTRVNGDVTGANIGEDSLSGSSSNNIGEVINYTPAMVMGGPFFNQKVDNFKVESLISLPPAF